MPTISGPLPTKRRHVNIILPFADADKEQIHIYNISAGFTLTIQNSNYLSVEVTHEQLSEQLRNSFNIQQKTHSRNMLQKIKEQLF